MTNEPSKVILACKRSLQCLQLSTTKRALADRRAEQVEDNKRHASWLRRSSQSPAIWQPRKIHRSMTSHLLSIWGAQYKECTGRRNGLKHLVYDPTQPQWKDWRKMPALIAPMDLASEDVAATSAAMYKFNVSLEPFCDPSHGVHDDINNAITAVGLRPLVVLGVVNANLEYGPNDEAWRGSQLRDNLRHYVDNNTCKTAVLFQDDARHLIAELRAKGVEFEDGRPGEEIAWEHVRLRAESGRKGRKVSLARFMEGLSTVLAVTSDWYMQKLERSVTALNENCLKGRRFDEKVVKAGAVEAHLAEKSTKAAVDVNVRMFKENCENGVAVSCMFLSDDTTRRLLLLIRVACRPLQEWHSSQNHELRSREGVVVWMTDAVCGGATKHAASCVQPLTTETLLTEAGFTLDERAARGLRDDVVTENEFAATYAELCMQCVARRLRRLLLLSNPCTLR